LADRIYSWQANANAMFEPQAVPTRVDDLFSRVILRNSREMVQRTLLMSNYFSQNGVRITVTVRVCPQICGWEKYSAKLQNFKLLWPIVRDPGGGFSLLLADYDIGGKETQKRY